MLNTPIRGESREWWLSLAVRRSRKTASAVHEDSPAFGHDGGGATPRYASSCSQCPEETANFFTNESKTQRMSRGNIGRSAPHPATVGKRLRPTRWLGRKTTCKYFYFVSVKLSASRQRAAGRRCKLHGVGRRRLLLARDSHFAISSPLRLRRRARFGPRAAVSSTNRRRATWSIRK